MRNLIKFVSLATIYLTIIFSQTLVAERKPTVDWYMYDLPPYHILQGEYQQQGPLDYIYSLWREWLPEYQHRSIAVNITRMKREFQSKKDFRCITSSFKFPESIGHWLWSKALYVEPPAVIVARSELAARFSKKESINLAQLLDDKTITFGHFDGRIYLGEVDNTIEQYLGNSNVLSVGSYAPGESLMRMLQRGRVDYIIEYLPEIHWLMLSGQLENKVNFITINIENHTALSPVFVGCVDTKWGRQTIEMFNSRINNKVRQGIWEKYEKWLYNDFAIKRFHNIQQEYFSTQ